MVDIILWRHAEAEIRSNSGDDHDRVLTRKGREDAHKMAKWLHKHLPAGTKIVCSPALRCVETAEALIKLNTKKIKREIHLVDVLKVESNATAINQHLLNDNYQQTILLIGHQPILGELVDDLLHGRQHQMLENQLTIGNGCVIKKGAVWWLRQRIKMQDDGLFGQVFVLTVQHPDFLAKS